VSIVAWGLALDVLLHAAVWMDTSRRRSLGGSFTAAFAVALLHLYVVLRRRAWHARHRRPLVALRRGLITYVCCHSCRSLLVPAATPAQLLRNFVGGSGAAFLAVLQLQLREMWPLNVAYNAATMASRLGTRSACTRCWPQLVSGERLPRRRPPASHGLHQRAGHLQQQPAPQRAAAPAGGAPQPP
jgi:hypothetical protein